MCQILMQARASLVIGFSLDRQATEPSAPEGAGTGSKARTYVRSASIHAYRACSQYRHRIASGIVQEQLDDSLEGAMGSAPRSKIKSVRISAERKALVFMRHRRNGIWVPCALHGRTNETDTPSF